ncbi:MAG: precorrin-6A reductase [Candidatus Methanoplasma sp.]|jgi:precorrin-6Y C5,15-methyltransferase (decarboxylating)|nr:precorrin-6A reductase [Candidatus Methanoplasma sp.]
MRDRYSVIVFAGTTEGRKIAEYLGNAGIDVLVCVATEFGRRFVKEDGCVRVSSERLGEEGMRRIMKEGCSCVIDATHPYATVISGKIAAACEDTGSEYIRMIRTESREEDDIIAVPDVSSAVEYLKGTEGNILVTTGSKELGKYTEIEDYRERVFARVLSMPTASQTCAEIGFEGKNLFCMQGPFCEELNYGLLKQIDAKYMVTKDSGEPGGFEEKVRAARRAGTKVVMISRPKESEGYTFKELMEMLGRRFGIKPSDEPGSDNGRKITIVGIGMGNEDTLTVGARRTIDDADLLVGAERMINSVSRGQDSFAEYRPDLVIGYLNENPGYRRIAILVSGDTGFHSATKKLLEMIDTSVFDVDVKCGVSSIAYLCSLTGSSWDDAFLMSAHGCDANIVGAVRANKKVIVLLNGSEGAERMCRELAEYGMDDVTVTIGQDLGQAGERVSAGRPSDIGRTDFGKLCIAMIENPNPDTRNPIGIHDGSFIRGDAPMTKEEIRSLSVIKLKLGENSVLFDIGAGTGSVAVESALSIPHGKVYAIEKENDAADLIRQNKMKFGAYNLEIAEGHAPEVLKGLPAPSHVFIGGSSGNLKEIMEACLSRNPRVRFVINAITLETVSEMVRCFGELSVDEEEVISLNVSRSNRVGRYHLMNAHNPIYIGVCRGRGQ